MDDLVNALEIQLFGDEETSIFAVLDGASVPDLQDALYRCQPEYECLYRGELDPDLAEVAPYLVRLLPASDFSNWVLSQGWGKHWGIFAVSHADIRVLRRHFRTFLVVHDSAGKPMYFRYYDPRVLRVYIPTCNPEELAGLFGPVDCYILEGETPNTILRFRNGAGSVLQEKKELVIA